MKLKIIALMLVLIMSVGAVISCGAPQGGGESGGEGGTEGENTDNGGEDEADDGKYADYLYGGSIIPDLIYADGMDTKATSDIYGAVRDCTGQLPYYFYDSQREEAGHEIVIGRTDRAVSKRAYRELDILTAEGGYDAYYVIYALGNSVAIAFDDAWGSFAAKPACSYFAKEIMADNSELDLRSGVVYCGSVSVYDHYKAEDEVAYAEKWEEFQSCFGEDNAELGEQITEAMQEYYASINHDVVSWIANLYDPGVGGFYYSNSARDHELYAPDIESTIQALDIIESFGRFQGLKWTDILNEKAKNEILVYIKSLQDKNGYFYNYQWDKAKTDKQPIRLSRDLNSAVVLLRDLGARPTYDTPTGVKGDGKVVVGTYDPTPLMHMTEPLGFSSVAVAAAKVVAVSSYNSNFENMEALNAYLEELLNKTSSFYYIGSELSSAMPQIKAQDQKLEAEFYADPANKDKLYESMCDRLVEWFNGYQDPETGLWGADKVAPADYDGINGLLKISDLYNSAERAIPNAEKAVASAMEVIISGQSATAIVHIYNVWSGASKVIRNVREYGSDITDKDGNTVTKEQRLDNLYAVVHSDATQAIAATREMAGAFEKEDGSYSYLLNSSSATSQGMPVAVPKTNEGDVNATLLALTNMIGSMCGALGAVSVPVFGSTDLCVFQSIFENLTPVIKHTNVLLADAPVSFESDTVGEPSLQVVTGFSTGGNTVKEHDKDGLKGKYMNVTAASGAGGNIHSKNNSKNKNGNCIVFESDIRINSAECTKSYLLQFIVGKAYMLSIHLENDGSVLLRESTTTDDSTARKTAIARVEADRWFKLRIEYYKNGIGDDPRVIIFVDGAPVAVSDGFLGMKKNESGEYSGTPNTGEFTGTAIYKLKDMNISVDFDNLYSTCNNNIYTAPEDPDGKLTVNVDKK